MPDLARATRPSPPARLELVPVELVCGHQRRVDPGIGSLVAAGYIDHLWCLTCAADRAPATDTTTTDGAAVHEGDTHA